MNKLRLGKVTSVLAVGVSNPKPTHPRKINQTNQLKKNQNRKVVVCVSSVFDGFCVVLLFILLYESFLFGADAAALLGTKLNLLLHSSSSSSSSLSLPLCVQVHLESNKTMHLGALPLPQAAAHCVSA